MKGSRHRELVKANEVSLHRLIRKWRDDPRLRKLPVVVCTGWGTFTGDAYRLNEQRLLDALNRGFVARALRLARGFVPLTDVEAYFTNGRRASLESIHIQKASILFVGEKGCGQGETATGSQQSRGTQLSRKKTLVRAELYMPPYVLEGNVHVEMWEELSETIEVDTRFLPLTDVIISPPLADGGLSFGFVAVNKEEVLYITECPRRPH